MNKGRIEVICGPMFSGKSEELLRRLKRADIAKRPYQLFKPAVDNRYSETEVVSHSGQKMKCTPLAHARDIIERVGEDTKIVAIDEAQFFDLRLVATVLELTERGYRIVVAGLDMDSMGVPFGPMPQLLSIAEEVTKLTAVCEVGNTGQVDNMKDLTFKIVAFEEGNLTNEETVELFQKLIDTGIIHELQGTYQRMANYLIAEGLVNVG